MALGKQHLQQGDRVFPIILRSGIAICRYAYTKIYE